MNDKEYFSLNDIDFAEKRQLLKLLITLVNRLRREGVFQDHFQEEGEEFKLFIRFNSDINNSNDNYTSGQNKLWNSLTEKEKAVLYLLATGSKRCDTAYVLRISTNTLRQHLKSVYVKMGFHNKVQMAIWCSNFFNLY